MMLGNGGGSGNVMPKENISITSPKPMESIALTRSLTVILSSLELVITSSKACALINFF